MHYGDLGKRIVAFILDGIILNISYLLIFYLISAALVSPYTYWYGWLPIFSIVTPFISFFYFVLMEGGSWHATLGKKIMGLYVGDANGTGITYSVAVLRYIGRLLSSLIFGVGYIMGFFDSRKQCLHDMLAKTYVYSDAYYSNRVSPNIPQYNGAGVNYGGEPKLIGVSGALAGVAFNVPPQGLLMGRDPISCQVVIPANQNSVSRNHCYITYNSASDMFVLNDRNSSQGTFLADGRRVYSGQPAALRRGDRFYLATSLNMFEVR